MARDSTIRRFSSLAVQNRATKGSTIKNGAAVATPPAPVPATTPRIQSPARQPTPAESSERLYSGFARLTLLLLGFYVFEHTTFAGELLANFAHIRFPVVAITGAVVTVCALFSGRLLQFLRTPLAIPWIFLYAWMVLASLFSFWARASVGFVIPYGLRFQLMPFLFCALAVSTRAVRDLLTLAGSGLLVVLALCITKGTLYDGRLVVPATDMLNPNDLAFHLLWLSMLAAVFLLNRGVGGKLLSAAMIPLSVWYMLKTGSRANLLTFIVLFGVVFVLVPRGTRALLALGTPVAVIVVLTVLPRSTLNRMMAIVLTSSEQEVATRTLQTKDAELRGAIGSQAARMELQKLAISATLRHPVFGVGPLMFENETAANILKNTGQKAPWQTAHNSYLKISSETGVIGFLLYLWTLVAAFRLTYDCYKRTQKRPELKIANGNSVAILLALVVFGFGSFFCDIVYLSYLGITLGLASANYLAVAGDEAGLETAIG